MTIEFNFNRLKNVYIEALHSLDKTLEFDLKIGRGRFLFMMFLSEEDEQSRDILYVYMRNTRIMKKIKMYGNHIKGIFKVYINECVQKCFVQELQLQHSEEKFIFTNFLNQLNECIPQRISMDVKRQILKDDSDIIKKLNVVADADKTVLIGCRKLSIGTPQYKTLRKLYMYTNSSVQDIADLIGILKKMNMTVAWTTPNSRYEEADIRRMIRDLR